MLPALKMGRGFLLENRVYMLNQKGIS